MKKRWPIFLAILVIILGVFVYLYFLHPDSVPILAQLGLDKKDKVQNDGTVDNGDVGKIDKNDKTDKHEESSTYLIYGLDHPLETEGVEGELIETDLVFTATLNSETKTVDIIFIPPNTFFNDRQIKDIYAEEGVEGLKVEIGKLNDQSFDGYIGVDYQTFVELIDVLDGIQVKVDETIDLPKYGLSIHPGINKLNGETTLKLLRLKRGKTTIIERIDRQNSVFLAIYHRLLEIRNLSKIQEVSEAILTIRKKLETNVESDQILKGFTFFKKGINEFKIEILSGEIVDEQWIPINKPTQKIK